MNGDTLPTLPISECYDNFLHKSCVVTHGNSMNSGLTGWAWVIILIAVAIPTLIIVCYISDRKREDRIMEQGGDPMIHIGNVSIRPSTVKLALVLGFASRSIRNHKPITSTPEWRNQADQDTRDMWGRDNQP